MVSAEASFFFQRHDANGDGMLCFTCFCEALHQIGFRPPAMPEDPETEEALTARDILAEMRMTRPLPAALQPHEAEFKRQFAMADVDSDGVLTYPEWLSFYSSHVASWRTPKIQR